MITTELFALPRCGLSSHQAPDLAESMSSSSALNKEMRAARRIPPARTASAMWQMMSCTSIGVSLSPFSLASKIPSTFTKHSLKGCGPGAFPPDVISLAPFGRISEKSKRSFEVPLK